MEAKESLEQRLLSVAGIDIGKRQEAGRRRLWYKGAGEVGYLSGSGHVVLRDPEVISAYATLLNALNAIGVEYGKSE